MDSGVEGGRSGVEGGWRPWTAAAVDGGAGAALASPRSGGARGRRRPWMGGAGAAPVAVMGAAKSGGAARTPVPARCSGG